jgi:hypothetical protein
MQMVLVGLSPGPRAGAETSNPEIVTDILWAAAIPEDHLEHIRARHGPDGRDIHVALFHDYIGCELVSDIALRLCLRAVTGAPVLTGWTAFSLERAPATPTAWALGTETP